MCGIIGSVGESVDRETSFILTTALLRETQRRGFHATGHFAINHDRKIDFFKAPIPSKTYTELDPWLRLKDQNLIALLGHARAATSGNWKNNLNNHPFISKSGNIGLIHNGSLSLFRDMKEQFIKRFKCTSECDSEVLLKIILSQSNICQGIQKVYELFGSTGDFTVELLYRNPRTGAITFYLFRDPGRPARFINALDILGQYYFCSTTAIWNDAIKTANLQQQFENVKVEKIKPYVIWKIDAQTMEIHQIAIDVPKRKKLPKNNLKSASRNKKKMYIAGNSCYGYKEYSSHDSVLERGFIGISRVSKKKPVLWFHTETDRSDSSNIKHGNVIVC